MHMAGALNPARSSRQLRHAPMGVYLFLGFLLPASCFLVLGIFSLFAAKTTNANALVVLLAEA
jgi:hypothetical protein